MGKIICFIVLAMAATSAVAQNTERRCGWVDNPTPANWWILDRHDDWELSRQGGSSMSSSNGFWDLPDDAFHFGDDWVHFNDFNGYGYGYGCVDGHFVDGFAVSVEAMELLPLARCEMDPALPQREMEPD